MFFFVFCLKGDAMGRSKLDLRKMAERLTGEDCKKLGEHDCRPLRKTLAGEIYRDAGAWAEESEGDPNFLPYDCDHATVWDFLEYMDAAGHWSFSVDDLEMLSAEVWAAADLIGFPNNWKDFATTLVVVTNLADIDVALLRDLNNNLLAYFDKK